MPRRLLFGLPCWLSVLHGCLVPVVEPEGVDAGLRPFVQVDAGADAGQDGGALLDAGDDGGTPCTRGTFRCEAVTWAQECLDGGWRSLPCRGPNGCQLAAGLVQCDLRGSLEGDACPQVVGTRALCTVDGGGTLECRGGAFVLTNLCRTCSMSGDTVVCQP